MKTADVEGPRAFVEAHTEVSFAPLCPELRLRLITPNCELWHYDERALESLDIPPPYWGFAWPGGQALARYLLDHPHWVSGRKALDFGSGSGLVALAAKRCGASQVTATEIDPLAVEACCVNAELNQLELEAMLQDLLEAPDRSLPEAVSADVILVGDTTYEASLGSRVLAWLCRQVRAGAVALVAEPERGFLKYDALKTLAEVEAPSDIDFEGRYTTTVRIFAVE